MNMVCQAMIAGDIHAWERKNLQNQRFTRLQNLVMKGYQKTKNIKHRITEKFQEHEKKIQEVDLKIGYEINKRVAEILREHEKSAKRVSESLEKLDVKIDKRKTEI
mmetsp:Transcript_2465/g.3116  ORF Transcript_2465/g.3116 Transcript_2465/m.3116 type:complete len:106 (+) Transcript_2465:165-482(+)